MSVDSNKPNHKNSSDWQYRTGVKMSNKDHTYLEIKQDKKLDIFKNRQEHAWKKFTLWQRFDVEQSLKLQKQQAAELLQTKKKGLVDAKKRARSKSCSKSADPPATRLRSSKEVKSRK